MRSKAEQQQQSFAELSNRRSSDTGGREERLDRSFDRFCPEGQPNRSICDAQTTTSPKKHTDLADALFRSVKTDKPLLSNVKIMFHVGAALWPILHFILFHYLA